LTSDEQRKKSGSAYWKKNVSFFFKEKIVFYSFTEKNVSYSYTEKNVSYSFTEKNNRQLQQTEAEDGELKRK